MRAGKINEGLPLLALVSALLFTDSLGYGLLVPLLPRYSQELGVSDLGLGFLFAAYAIAGLLGVVPLGWLSDRLGRKPFILFGMFAMSGAFVFYALARGYPMLLAARFLDGLTAAATWCAGLALLGDAFPGEVMGEKTGFAMGASAAGAIAGPLAGGLLYALAGYRAPFLAVAAVCAAVGSFAVFLGEEGEARTAGRGLVRTALPMLGNRRIMLACFITMLTTFGFGMLEPTLPLHLQRRFSLGPLSIGMFFGGLTAAYALASPPIGRLSDRIGRRAPILWGLAGTALLVPALAVVPSAFLAAAALTALGATAALFGTTALPLITDSLPRKPGRESGYGTAYGIFNIFWSVGYALGPLAGGAVYQAAGLLHAYLLFSVLLAVLMVAVAIYLRKRE